MKFPLGIFFMLISCTPNKKGDNKAQSTPTKLTPIYSYEQLVVGSDTLPYRLLLPENYSAGQSYPLVLFLHGSGERGKDNKMQLVHGSVLFLKPAVRKQYPAIVVFPQCAQDSTWSYLDRNESEDGEIDFKYAAYGPMNTNQKLLKALITKLNKTYKLDENRHYIGGLSLGGMGTFETIKYNPEMFAAAFPICGGAHPDLASQLTTPSWWIFHGEADSVVPVQHSTDIYKALIKAGAEAKISLYPEVGHDSWNKAFAEPKLLEWLFGQRLE